MVEPLRLVVNGEPMPAAEGTTVADVVARLGCGTRGVAVAVNSELVPRGQWEGFKLADGDRVEVLHAVAGG